MKRVVLAIAATLVLIALPAVAQYTDPSTTTQPSTTTTEPSTTTTTTETTAPADTSMTPPSNNLDTSTTTTTTTTETVDPNAPVQEERTNPVVPTHGPGSGLTASGSVVSSNDEEIVLRTATGITHFKLIPATTGVTAFTEGQRLTIDFTRNEQGVLIAQQVRPEGSTTSELVTPGAAATGVATEIDTTASTTTTPAAVPESTTTTTTETETENNLPATGSNAPLAGLLGLLALGGAAALRRL
ncbi:MAG TPA: LPXTG cell wall anchor domain-containing protein [Thermoanaerobaculia bacterium]|nr:LPXTG cell wall anchor domain-containing protein [Thermoanaerobaculia bacterium]HXT51554.1 LPXTG cell wall anchor domain-containing protein [Thermoanaerobaculia bacterium]